MIAKIRIASQFIGVVLFTFLPFYVNQDKGWGAIVTATSS
jgi:hypothetical protein